MSNILKIGFMACNANSSDCVHFHIYTSIANCVSIATKVTDYRYDLGVNIKDQINLESVLNRARITNSSFMF